VKDGIVQKPRPHQRRVVALMRRLGVEPASVLATNGIFLESKNVAALRPYGPIWGRHWGVHRKLLSIVGPEWIICLGAGKTDSAYALINQKIQVVGAVEEVPGTGGPAARMYRGLLAQGEEGGDREVSVLAVPHPSRWDPVEVADRMLTKLGWPAQDSGDP